MFPQAVSPGSSFGSRGISPSATVHPDARLEQDVIVDPGSVIGPGAEIGSGSSIGPHAMIGPQVRIGRDCIIGPGTRIANALDRQSGDHSCGRGHRPGRLRFCGRPAKAI